MLDAAALMRRLCQTSKRVGCDSAQQSRSRPTTKDANLNPAYASMTRVLAAVIEREGRLLLCKRPQDKRHGGLWEFPGGKVQEGESDDEAARRELAEELGVHVTRVHPVAYSVNDEGSEFLIEFLRVEIEGEPTCFEHTELAWVLPSDVLAYPLAPCDRRFVLDGQTRSDAGPGDCGSAPFDLERPFF